MWKEHLRSFKNGRMYEPKSIAELLKDEIEKLYRMLSNIINH
jgi:hypothetical protein